MEADTAVILCGGMGTRLRPITYEIPKPLIPVQGKAILQHNIDLFKRHGVKNIILAVGHMAERIQEHFGDGSSQGISIRYLLEKEPMGTAGALRMLNEQGMLPEKPFFYCNGDELKDIPLDRLEAFHKDSNAKATIALTAVEDTSQFGVVRLDGKRILEFVEKPAPGTEPSKLINSGLYMLHPGVARMVPAGKVSIERDIFPSVASESALYGFPFDGQWFPTDDFSRLERAILSWKDPGVGE